MWGKKKKKLSPDTTIVSETVLETVNTHTHVRNAQKVHFAAFIGTKQTSKMATTNPLWSER